MGITPVFEKKLAKLAKIREFCQHCYLVYFIEKSAPRGIAEAGVRLFSETCMSLNDRMKRRAFHWSIELFAFNRTFRSRQSRKLRFLANIMRFCTRYCILNFYAFVKSSEWIPDHLVLLGYGNNIIGCVRIRK